MTTDNQLPVRTETGRATPRPWDYFIESYDDGTMFVTAVTREGIRVIEGEPVASGVSEENAALIVEAVNAYDRLRAIEAAAREVVRTHGGYASGVVGGPDPKPEDFKWTVSGEALDALRAALEGPSA